MNKNKSALPHEPQRGEIKDNALQAFLRSPLYRQRIEKKRKGKGSYERTNKKVSWESGLKLSPFILAMI